MDHQDRLRRKKAVRVVRLKRRKPVPQDKTDPEKRDDSEVTTKRPTGTSLAFHRQGGRLRVVPLVEKRILEKERGRKIRRGILLNDGQANVGLRTKGESEQQKTSHPRNRNFGKVTFREDGSINIKLLDSDSERQIDHVIESKPKREARKPEETDASTPEGARNELFDPAGTSGTESSAADGGASELKLWTYEDLLILAQRLSQWIQDGLHSQKPTGERKLCVVVSF